MGADDEVVTEYYNLSDVTGRLKASVNGFKVTGLSQRLLRLACYEDGQCLLVKDSDGGGVPGSGQSGGYSWGICDTFDVALGTYKMSTDGNKVECNWTKHFQRKLRESGDEHGIEWDDDEKFDSGWTEMGETAAWKW